MFNVLDKNSNISKVIISKYRVRISKRIKYERVTYKVSKGFPLDK
jgi:hypothetical protein